MGRATAVCLGLCLSFHAPRLVLAAPLVVSPCGRPQVALIQDSDLRMLRLASEKKFEYCRGLGELDVDGGHDRLKSIVGSQSVIETAARESESKGEFSAKVSGQIDEEGALRRTASMVLAIVFAIIWFICCWSGWPCCRCYGCLAKRNTGPSRPVRSALCLCFFSILVIIIVGVFQVEMGHSECIGGMQSMACATAELMEGVLGGFGKPAFVGFVPLLRRLQDIMDIFPDGSTYVNETATLLDKTAIMTDALTVVRGSLNLLDTMVTVEENVHPAVSNVASTDTCILCAEFQTRVNAVHSLLNGSYGEAFRKCVIELDDFVSSRRRCRTETDLTETLLPPLIGFKNLLSENVGAPLLETRATTQVLDDVNTKGYWAIHGITLGIGLCFVISVWTSLEWALKEKLRSDGEFPEYNVRPHRGACFTWCGMIFLIFPAFFVGGFIQATTSSLSEICLLFDDLDGNMARDMGGVLGYNFSTENGKVLLDMVDKCVHMPFPRPAALPNANLLKLIPGGSAGYDRNMHAYIREAWVEPLSTVFDELYKASTHPLSDEAVLVSLRATLREESKSIHEDVLDSQEKKRCDVFEDMKGAACDIKDMVGVIGQQGNYMNDCLHGSGPFKTMKRKKVACTLENFAQYMHDWDERLRIAFKRLDDVLSPSQGIGNRMKNVTNLHFLTPVDHILTGITCGFMPETIQGLIDSFCYQGVPGLRRIAGAYILLGSAAVVLAFVMYCLWRRALANVNSAAAAHLERVLVRTSHRSQPATVTLGKPKTDRE